MRLETLDLRQKRKVKETEDNRALKDCTKIQIPYITILCTLLFILSGSEGTIPV